MAEPTDPPVDPPDPANPPADPPAPDVEGLKTALANERDNAKNARKAQREAEAEVERLKKAGASEVEQAKAQAKAEAREEIASEMGARVQNAEIIAAAAGKLRNPGYAPKLIDRSLLKIEDGVIDPKSLDQAIAALLKEDPSLAQGNLALPGGSGRPGGKEGSGTTVDDRIRSLARGRR